MHVVNNHKPDHRLVTSPHVLLLRTHAYYPPVNVKPHLPQAGQRWGFANFNCEMPHPSGKCCSLLIPTPQDRELTQIFFSRQYKESPNVVRHTAGIESLFVCFTNAPTLQGTILHNNPLLISTHCQIWPWGRWGLTLTGAQLPIYAPVRILPLPFQISPTTPPSPKMHYSILTEL